MARPVGRDLVKVAIGLAGCVAASAQNNAEKRRKRSVARCYYADRKRSGDNDRGAHRPAAPDALHGRVRRAVGAGRLFRGLRQRADHLHCAGPLQGWDRAASPSVRAVSRPRSSSRSPIATVAPASTISRAVSPPMPRAAPEISATFPSDGSSPALLRRFRGLRFAIINKFSAETPIAERDPHAPSRYGIALATLDDDPGLRPAAHTSSPIRRLGSKLPTICRSIPKVVSPERRRRFPMGYWRSSCDR